MLGAQRGVVRRLGASAARTRARRRLRLGAQIARALFAESDRQRLAEFERAAESDVLLERVGDGAVCLELRASPVRGGRRLEKAEEAGTQMSLVAEQLARRQQLEQ